MSIRGLGMLAIAATRMRVVLAAAAIALIAPSAIWADDYKASGEGTAPTAGDYIAHIGAAGGRATLVDPGALVITGHRVSCGQRPVVLDPGLDDYAAAYDGFIILNPTKLAGLPAPVALWIYSHECGHQFKGPDEDGADCFASQRGRRQGWLKPDGVEQICNFISPSHGDMMHFAGPLRCQTVRRCYGAKDNF